MLSGRVEKETVVTRPSFSILVLGGGIGGMATALAIARRGRRVHLIERSPVFEELGAGLQLAPNALRVLDELGVLEQVERHAVFPKQIVLRDIVSAEQLAALDLGADFVKRYRYRYLVIHRSDLLAILVDACKDSGLVTFDTGKEAVSVEDLLTGARVVCADGSEYLCNALIAADGLWSTVRRMLFVKDTVECPKYVAYRGTIPTADVATHVSQEDLVIWCGPEMHLVQYPVRGGELFNQVAVFRSHRYVEGTDDWGTVEELDQHFSQACPYVQSALTKIGRAKRWPLFDRVPIITWARNNIVLMGDAAHPMLQFVAQGACQALEDALCLADLVDRFEGDTAAAFVAFQNTRFLRTARVQLTARFFEHFWHPQGVGAKLRDEYLSRRAANDYVELDWLYALPQ